jgi:hypothetical protein
MGVVAAKGQAGDTMPGLSSTTPARAGLWQLDIVELAGHDSEARGREEVNRLLQAGWVLLHIYTLKYHEDGIRRDRPTAILGRPKGKQVDTKPRES